MIREEKTTQISSILTGVPTHQAEKIQTLFSDIISDIQEKDLEIANLKKELHWLKEQIKLGKQRQFGRSTEKTEALQLEMVFNEGETDTNNTEETKEEETETVTYTRRKAKQRGRQLDTSKL